MEVEIKKIEKLQQNTLKAINYIAGVLENLDLRMKDIVKEQKQLAKDIKEIKNENKLQNMTIIRMNEKINEFKQLLPELKEINEELFYKINYGEKGRQIRILENELKETKRQYNFNKSNRLRNRIVELQKMRDDVIYK
jgi:chromosome segregation ATPase